ncbi:TetR/AcrR family transcriptional regulator [Paenibacillus sp. y28]|uniref:TetR/AcrR family transcriptional regulator n=1 Tax=Paenibacillus sp. y28 TaxID=3129110 RepID=UPI0030182773
MPRVGLDLPSILQAAAELADSHGLDEVTLASLAHKLAIRPPSLYNHINGLNGLRKKLAIYSIQRLTAAIQHAAVGHSGDEAVHAVGEAYFAFALRHPGLYDATLRAPDPRDPEVQEAGAELLELLVRALQAYGLDTDSALHTIRGLRSLLHGFTSLEQKGGFGLPLDLHESLRLMLDTYLAGIRATSRAFEEKETSE